ncbi:RNA-binding KH domain-containing protein PEPPER-like [Canna indica]|uniref:RNA-binding KH domain-containing protein PEPPER-like n=1 Tax=Canna indica TaxID=4628 RepID=A0AAQ3K2I4_9LILI|nr:RNA-binding KH domain-containing protein PEPPER-like [Canna indica]
MAANPADTDGHAPDSELAQEVEAIPDAPDAEAEPPVAASAQQKWPGWPGDNVFRLIVPVTKVGSIIGRKGELIKKLCDESRAKVRILEGAVGTPDRIVLISAREEPEAILSPAMDAALRIFKRINDITENEGSSTLCSIKLLVASSQAITLIGKQGASVKSIQENSGATIRILPKEELPYYATAEERIVEIHGETLKVLKALEAVLGHLRKFLVDHSILPLFEKSLGMPTAQDHAIETWADKKQSSIQPTQQIGTGNDYSLSLNRDPLLLDRRTQIDAPYQRSRLSIYGQDPAVSGLHTPVLGRSTGSFVTQITQTMNIPLTYAEEIIGVGGGNISYIRRTSGAVITLEESRTVPDEIIVEIKGNSTQVQTAQQLIEDVVGGHKEPTSSSYSSLDTSYRPSYSSLSGSSYSTLSGSGYLSSSLTSRSLGGYGSSGLGGYGGYRL